MAAPSPTITHGSSVDLVNEPSTSSVLQCYKFTFKGQRERLETKDSDRAWTRLRYVNPHAIMTIEAAIIGSGLAIQEAGSEVSALANFAATRRGCDYAVGTMILEDPEDVLDEEQDDNMTTFNVLWAPFV